MVGSRNKTFIYFYLNQIEWPKGDEQRSRKTWRESRQVSENFPPKKRQEGREKLTICSRSVTMEIRACVEKKADDTRPPWISRAIQFFCGLSNPLPSRKPAESHKGRRESAVFLTIRTPNINLGSRVFAGSSGRLSSFYLSGTKKAENSTAGDQAVGA